MLKPEPQPSGVRMKPMGFFSHAVEQMHEHAVTSLFSSPAVCEAYSHTINQTAVLKIIEIKLESR